MCWSLCVPSGTRRQVGVTVSVFLQAGSGILARCGLTSRYFMQVPWGAGAGHCQVSSFSNHLSVESLGYF